MARSHSSHVGLRARLDDMLERVLHIERSHLRMEKEPFVLGSSGRGFGMPRTALFCGAGISIPAPSNAPSFVAMRSALVESCIRSLTRRGALSDNIAGAIRRAAASFPRLEAFELPPEILFHFVQDFIGSEAVTSILSCLTWGKPNYNHRGLADLITSGSIAGIITTNFDTYIEQASFGARGPKLSGGERGLILKPHGSLSRPETVVITFDKILSGVDAATVSAIRTAVTDSNIIVLGYSGYDDDVLPLIARAATAWGASIHWVLWTSESYNHRVAALQLALTTSMKVSNANGAPLFAELGEAGNAGHGTRRDLEEYFESILDGATTDALLGLLMTVAGPIEAGGVISDICETILNELKAIPLSKLQSKLQLLFRLCQFGQRHTRKAEIFALGHKAAMGANDPRWRRWFEHIARSRGAVQDQYTWEYDDAEFVLLERFWPGWASCQHLWPSFRLQALADRVDVMRRKGQYKSAIFEARRLLSTETFPETVESSVTPSHTRFEGDVRYALADALLEVGAEAEAAEQLDLAIGIFVRELYCAGTLRAVSRAEQINCRDCSQLASEIAKRMTRVAGMVWDELVFTSICLANGKGSKEDLDRVELLLRSANLTEEERASIDQCLAKLDRGKLKSSSARYS